ncbi:polysaccharide biosynthesis protein [Clostridium formicaceticum]|nr:nucleoside-diphosphate sugar epimerase/dehydratase [Clostridium formicaceticum]AOY78271.1 nucleoside-diphosphate sugar epimerase [Clostridium formicaceticum]
MDVFLINSSILAALWLRFDFTIPQLQLQNYYTTAVLTTVIMLMVFYMSNLYNSVWRYASIDELISIVAASFVGSSILFIVYFHLLRINFPRSMYPIAMLLLTASVGGSRFAYRFLRRVKRISLGCSMQNKRVLIIGGGTAGSLVIKEIYDNPQICKTPVAVIDDDAVKYRRKIHGVSILGNRGDIEKVVKEEKIQEIIIAMPSATKTEIRKIVDICTKTKCDLKILPGVYEILDGKVDIKKIRDVQIEDLLGREAVKVNLEEISDYLHNEVILVTGGGGSIGSELCRQIARFDPRELIILDIYENNAYEIQQELLRKHKKINLEVIIASIRDKKRIEQIFEKHQPKVIFHAAAHKHVPLMENNPMEAIKNNIFGTMNVAECAHQYGAKRFVLISTDKAVNPTNIMGATKRVAEMTIQAMNHQSETEFVAVRFGNVLGSNGSVIPHFKKQIAEGGPVTVTHPDIIRYFMTIPEAVQLVIQAGAMAQGGEIFVLDMGDPVKIADLARDLIRLSGFEPDTDIKIEFTGLRPGEKLYEELLLKEEGLQGTKHEKIFVGKPIVSDFKKLQRELMILRTVLASEDSALADGIVRKVVPEYRCVG